MHPDSSPENKCTECGTARTRKPLNAQTDAPVKRRKNGKSRPKINAQSALEAGRGWLTATSMESPWSVTFVPADASTLLRKSDLNSDID